MLKSVHLFRPFPSCRKGLLGLQRGCFRVPTESPSPSKGGPVADQGDPYGPTSGGFFGKSWMEIAAQQRFGRNHDTFLRENTDGKMIMFSLHSDGF